MKKIFAVACLSLASLGFSATSALASNGLTTSESPSASFQQVKEHAAAANLYLANHHYIDYQEWNSNILVIAFDRDEQKVRALHVALVNKIVDMSQKK